MKKLFGFILVCFCFSVFGQTDTVSVRVLEKSVVVPEHIKYPSIRLPINSGDIAKGSRMLVVVKIFDKNRVLTKEMSGIAAFREFPADTNATVLGVVKVNFVESSK